MSQEKGTHARLGHSEDQNSQIRGSSVIVYVEGAAMDFALVKSPEGKYPWTAKKKEYEYDFRLIVR